MKILQTITAFFLFLIINNCTENTIISSDGYRVYGTIIFGGKVAPNVIVRIDKSSSLKSETDSLGYFEINNVSNGNHELTALKNLGNGQFTERTIVLTVNGDTETDSLQLPKGVQLYDPQNVTSDSLQLIWSATDATDFREYKVYSHTSSGLDETTGLLIHVSTAFDDTVFNVSGLNPLTEYFFRIYVMNDYGRFGGSNIVSATTENIEVLNNGSFELLNSFTGYPLFWNAQTTMIGYYFVDSTIVQDGNYSIRIEDSPGVNYYYQLVNPANIISNELYRLTYWVKHDSLGSESEFAIFLNTVEFTWQVQANTISGPKPASDWTEYQYEFTAPNVTTSNYSVGFYFYLGGDREAWLDNISLVKVN